MISRPSAAKDFLTVNNFLDGDLGVNRAVIDFERCKECGYCVLFCPQKTLCIGKDINQKGYYPPIAQTPEKCTACAICARVCPDAAIEVFKE